MKIAIPSTTQEAADRVIDRIRSRAQGAYSDCAIEGVRRLLQLAGDDSAAAVLGLNDILVSLDGWQIAEEKATAARLPQVKQP